MRSRATGARGAAGLAAAAVLAFASTAAADTVNITRFSKKVSGTASSGVTSVTVDLLRNTLDANGQPVRTQVDTFTASVGSGGAWSGTFAGHAPSTALDQVQVDYTGGGANVTVGGGAFLPIASGSTAHDVTDPFDSEDGSFGLASDGKTLRCFTGSCSGGFTAAVDGTAAPAPVAGAVTFSTAVTATNAVTVTVPTTLGGTTVNLTDSAAMLTPLPSGVTGPVNSTRFEPACTAYVVTTELVCRNLDPGSYTLTQARGTSTVQTQTLKVPAQAANTSLIPSYGSASFGGFNAFDQVALSTGAHVLTTLTIDPVKYAFTAPIGDFLNGASSTVTGSCTAGLFFTDHLQSASAGNSADVCGPGAAIPPVNQLAELGTSLGDGGVQPLVTDTLIGERDDTSAGSTQVDMPQVVFSTPSHGEAIHTPFKVLAIAEYNDPGAMVTQADTAAGPYPAPILTGTISSAPVTFAYAPVPGTAFTPLGNVAVSGGVSLPVTLAPGLYDGEFTVTDARGDTRTAEQTFMYQGNATGPAGTAPAGPAAPSCSATSTGGLKAKIATADSHVARAHAAKAKAKPKPKPIKLTLTCKSSVAGARVALWLQRGSSVVADASGVVSRGAAKIALASAAIRKGTYQLIEVIDAKGLATEASHVLTLK
jgi:hypothetical protein